MVDDPDPSLATGLCEIHKLVEVVCGQDLATTSGQAEATLMFFETHGRQKRLVERGLKGP